MTIKPGWLWLCIAQFDESAFVTNLIAMLFNSVWMLVWSTEFRPCVSHSPHNNSSPLAQVTSQIMLIREATWMPLDLRWAAYAVFVAGLVLSGLLYVALHAWVQLLLRVDL